MFETVLLAVDGSEHSKRAVPMATELAKKTGAKVIVAHVREHDVSRGGRWELESDEEAQSVVDATLALLKDSGIEATGQLRKARIGRVAQEICDAADEDGASVIVMGTRGLSDLQGILLGSIAHKVIQLAACPVLVTR